MRCIGSSALATFSHLRTIAPTRGTIAVFSRSEFRTFGARVPFQHWRSCSCLSAGTSYASAACCLLCYSFQTGTCRNCQPSHRAPISTGPSSGSNQGINGLRPSSSTPAFRRSLRRSPLPSFPSGNRRATRWRCFRKRRRQWQRSERSWLRPGARQKRRDPPRREWRAIRQQVLATCSRRVGKPPRW
jgi:hypothetical protein